MVCFLVHSSGGSCSSGSMVSVLGRRESEHVSGGEGVQCRNGEVQGRKMLSICWVESGEFWGVERKGGEGSES